MKNGLLGAENRAKNSVFANRSTQERFTACELSGFFDHTRNSYILRVNRGSYERIGDKKVSAEIGVAGSHGEK